MPVHDWSKTEGNLWHDFHQVWCVQIRLALNSGLLPPGFSAHVDQRAEGLIPDVTQVKRRVRRDSLTPICGGAVATTHPRTRHVFESNNASIARRGNRVVVRHQLGEMVCAIEIVSPGNKSSKHAITAFINKAKEFLTNGVNMLIVDLFPPTPRDPKGIHKVIWDQFEEEPFELLSGKPMTLAAYVAGDDVDEIPARAFVEPIGFGDKMPDMPAYLDTLTYVPVPLEATYQAVWDSCPEDMRTLVETGRLPGDES